MMQQQEKSVTLCIQLLLAHLRHESGLLNVAGQAQALRIQYGRAMAWSSAGCAGMSGQSVGSDTPCRRGTKKLKMG